MVQKWEVKSHKIQGFPCASLVSMNLVTGEVEVETCLSGARGEIWEKGDGSYIAVEFVGEATEKIKYVKSQDFNSVRKSLKIPFRPEDQLRFDNNFNKL